MADAAKALEAGLSPSQQEVARLAALDPIECDRQAKAAAEKLGCSVTTLKAEVKRERARNADPETTGSGRRWTSRTRSPGTKGSTAPNSSTS